MNNNQPKRILTLAFASLILILSTATASAVTITPTKTVTPKITPTPTKSATTKITPTTTPVPDELDNNKTATVNQNLKKMIDKVVEQNKEKVKARLQEIGSRRRGFIGEIKNIREGAITLRTKSGTQVIPVDQGVEMFKAGKAITADKVSVGDWTVVVGATKDDAFIAESVEFLATSPRPKTSIVQLGTIVDIKKASLTFKSRKSGEESVLILDKNTQFFDSTNQKVTSSNFSANVQVLLIAIQGEDNSRVLELKALAPFTKIEPTSKATKN